MAQSLTIRLKRLLDSYRPALARDERLLEQAMREYEQVVRAETMREAA